MLHSRTSSLRKENPLEQYALVLDFEGAGCNNFDLEALQVTLQEGGLHYPNMVSQVYLLNVSWGARLAWASAQSLLNEKIKRKCMLVAPEDVASCMQKLLPLDQVPPEYGGSGSSWPAPRNAQTLEEQAGELAASIYLRAGVAPNGTKPPSQRHKEKPCPRLQEDTPLGQWPTAPSWGCFDSLCITPGLRRQSE